MSKGARPFLHDNCQAEKEVSKMAMKPISVRDQYRGVWEWSRNQLVHLQALLQQNEESEISTKILEDEKKVIISMLLEIIRIGKGECQEKGQIMEELLHYAIKFMNQHQKYYDMLSYTQIKHFRDSISELEKEYSQKNQQLKETISSLSADKEHRWRNIFMVVKDNRVLRRQKGKLLKKHKEEVWRTKQLEQDLINVRSQNEKYKLMCEEYELKENELKNYVTNQLLLLHLDEQVRQYPGRARRLLKKELLNCEINELNTLQQKIKFIIQSMEQNNEVCQELDDWDDNVNTTRLFYNVSVQTYIEVDSVGVNTVVPIPPKKTYQSAKSQTRYRDFINMEETSKVVDIKIAPVKKVQPQRKKTQQLSLSMSRFKRKASITNSNLNQLATQSLQPRFNDSSGFKDRLRLVQATVNLKFGGLRTVKTANFTSMVLNSQGQASDQDIKPEDSSRQIQKRTSKFKIVPRKQHSKHPDKKESTFSDMEHFHFGQVKFCHQIYELHYRPSSTGSSPAFDDHQFVLHLEQRGIQIQPRSKQKKLTTTGKRSSIRGNSLIKNAQKSTQNKPLKNQVSINDELVELVNLNAPILQVRQITSSHTLRSETHGFMDVLDFTPDNNQPSQQLNQIYSDQVRLSLIKKQKKGNEELKNSKISLFQKRHARQNTENLQIAKSKNKIIELMKYKDPTVDSQPLLENKESINKLRIRNSKVSMPVVTNEDVVKKAPQKSGNPVQMSQRKVTQVKVEVTEEKRTIKNEKLLDKLTSCIFAKRKEIILNPQCMRVFAQNFLLAIFESNRNSHYINKIRPQAIFYSSIKNVDIKQPQRLYICLLLQYLLPTRRYQLFAQDMLVLFAIMMDKLNSMGVLNNFSSLFHVPYQYSIKVMEYLCSIYLSESQSRDFLANNIVSKQEPIALNMVECFLKLYLHLDKIIFDSELWAFFDSISRWSADGLSQSDITDVLALLRLMDADSESHFRRISYYANRNFPLHRFCLYAHRFEWKRIYNIKTCIQDKYLDYFGFFSFTCAETNALCQQIQAQLHQNKKFGGLLRILKEMHFKHQKLKIEMDQCFIKLCRLTIVLDELENEDIFPNNLQLIQHSYRAHLKSCRSDDPL